MLCIFCLRLLSVNVVLVHLELKVKAKVITFDHDLHRFYSSLSDESKISLKRDVPAYPKVKDWTLCPGECVLCPVPTCVY